MGYATPCMRTTVNEDIPTKGFRKWIKNTVASVFESFFRSRGGMLSKECSFYFAHESVHATMLYFFVLSQDTLFLPDDSFFSLYRVFGVTEVFNEVLGDYYIVICLCSRGSLFGIFRSTRSLLFPFFLNISLSLPMWQCLFKTVCFLGQGTLFRRSFFVLTRFLASQVFNKALSIFVPGHFCLPHLCGMRIEGVGSSGHVTTPAPHAFSCLFPSFLVHNTYHTNTHFSMIQY